MNLDMLTLNSLERTRLRYLGKSNEELNAISEYNTGNVIMQLNYGSTDTYYFDLLRNDEGLEGYISATTFMVHTYTSGTGEITSEFSVNIADLSSFLTEEEFFQASTVNDYSSLTLWQMRKIIEIRDTIINNNIDWSTVK